jgi:hypothetical protein
MADCDVKAMQYPNARIYSYQSGVAMVASLLLLLMAGTATLAKPCLTKEEAKKLWPNEWLYWHTERHCWDHIKGTSTYEERQPEPTQPAANIVPAPLPKQVTTTKERSLPEERSLPDERRLPEPEIFYPTMVFNKANILEMMPLAMKQPWLSPHSISGWPLLLDVDRPSFREWEKRIGTE